MGFIVYWVVFSSSMKPTVATSIPSPDTLSLYASNVYAGEFRKSGF